MQNKMMAAEDHRYDTAPRPARNIDINRCLAVVDNGATMVNALDALRAQFGPFVKFKNAMALSQKEATAIFHLRLCLVSVLFEHPTLPSFRALREDTHVQELWRDYQNMDPDDGVPRGQWDRDVARALAWLHSEDAVVADAPVRIVCEIQCLHHAYVWVVCGGKGSEGLWTANWFLMREV
jgi:hypothetical protein